MHPIKKLIAGLSLTAAGLLPLSAGAVTAPSMADAHTNSALPANNFGNLPALKREKIGDRPQFTRGK